MVVHLAAKLEGILVGQSVDWLGVERAVRSAYASVVRWVASMESHSAQLRDLVTAVWMALKTGMSLAEDWDFDWDVWSVASMAVSRVDEKVYQ